MTDSDSLGLRSGSDVLRPLCVARALVAHTPSSRGRWHGLDEHSRAVGDLAAEFAEPFGGADVARLAGYLHDAGKATQEVQDRFRALGLSTGGKRERLGVPHKFEGGRVAASLIGMRSQRLALAMYQIMVGHHTGIPAVDVTRTEYLRGALSDPEELAPLSRLMATVVDTDLSELAGRCAYRPTWFLRPTHTIRRRWSCLLGCVIRQWSMPTSSTPTRTFMIAGARGAPP